MLFARKLQWLGVFNVEARRTQRGAEILTRRREGAEILNAEARRSAEGFMEIIVVARGCGGVLELAGVIGGLDVVAGSYRFAGAEALSGE